MQKTTATKVLTIFVVALAITGVVMFVLRAAQLQEAIYSGAFAPASPYDEGFVRHPGLTMLHMLPGLIFVILGPLQFHTALRIRHSKVHRWCGRAYVACGAIMGLTALVMGVVIGFGGATETAAVTFFSTLFLVFLGLAVFRIRQRDVAAHREWMIRAFALGLAVTTMRPMVGLLMAFAKVSFSEALGISFWLAFTLHMMFAELWINFTRGQRMS